MERKLLNAKFWGDATERMIGAAGTAALGVIGTGAVGILDIAWPTVGSIAGGAALVSLIMSVVAGTTTDPATAGFVTHADRGMPRIVR
ncbi:holin [Nonomuraea sp. NPDC059023]|uniref:holin n=1 Tax=unclassified Nonomuraea TaxID=2593643 RepID=UPI00368B28D3